MRYEIREYFFNGGYAVAGILTNSTRRAARIMRNELRKQYPTAVFHEVWVGL